MKKPVNLNRSYFPLLIIVFLLFDGTLIWRPYATIGDVSLPAIGGILGLVYCLLKRPFPRAKLTSFTSCLLIILTVFLAVSNYSYFQQLDVTIFNNLILFILILWVFNDKRNKNLYLSGIAIACGIVFLLAEGFYSIISEGIGARSVLSGNPRQVAFFTFLIFPCLFLIYIKKTKLNILLGMILQISVGLYVIMAGGRLNIIILFSLLTLFFILPVGTLLANRKTYFIGLISLIVLGVSTVGITEFFLSGQVSGVRELLSLGFYSPQSVYVGKGRVQLYEGAFNAFLDHPIFGMGYKSWKDFSNLYNPFRYFREEELSVHSFFLQLLAETGIIGFTLYFCLIFCMIKKGWRWMGKCSFAADDMRVRVGATVFFLGLLFMLGGALDNHGLHYRHFYFAAALTTLYLDERESFARRIWFQG